jgi:hypothetical protein
MKTILVWFVLAMPAQAALVDLFQFPGNPPAQDGNGGAGITFAGASFVGTFNSPDLLFGDNWAPNGLTNNWGADIFAYVNVATPGNYSFSTTSDDGSMLYMDGQMVVSNNFYQGDTLRSGSINLSAGTHLMEVQYFQGGGGTDLTVPLPAGITYVNPPTLLLNVYSSPVPTDSNFPSVRPGDTFVGSIPTDNVDYATMFGSNWFPFGLQNNFVAELHGFFIVPTGASYTFSTTSDDGSWLLIDGSMVVNNGFFQGLTTRQGSISLSAGAHPFDLQYFQGGGGAGLDMTLPAGVTMAPIPEPGTFGLLAVVLAAAFLRYRISRRPLGNSPF